MKRPECFQSALYLHQSGSIRVIYGCDGCRYAEKIVSDLDVMVEVPTFQG